MANGPKKACLGLIAIKDSISFKCIKQVSDAEGHYVILLRELNNTIFTLVNLYPPNTNQKKFLAPLFTKVLELRQGSLIMGWDFNSIVDLALDTSTIKWQATQSLLPLLHKYDLYDIWRSLHGFKKDFIFLSSPTLPILGSTFFSQTKGHFRMCSDQTLV